MSDCADEVGLAASGQSERENVVSALDEAAFAERWKDLRDLRRQARAREHRERLLAREISGLDVPLDATATSLAMIPLYKAGLVRLDSVSIDAKSGTTGAGKKAEERLLHAEVDGGCLPYRIGRHQHEPEISEAVAHFGLGSRKKSSDVSFSFVPHLLPVRRGIIVSVHARLNPGVQEKDVSESFESVYGTYPLVRLASLNEGETSDLVLRRVVGSARTVIAWHVRGDQLIVFSLIDNLLKGAASQAVENFNRFCGLNVETGLSEREGVL